MYMDNVVAIYAIHACYTSVTLYYIMSYHIICLSTVAQHTPLRAPRFHTGYSFQGGVVGGGCSGFE